MARGSFKVDPKTGAVSVALSAEETQSRDLNRQVRALSILVKDLQRQIIDLRREIDEIRVQN